MPRARLSAAPGAFSPAAELERIREEIQARIAIAEEDRDTASAPSVTSTPPGTNWVACASKRGRGDAPGAPGKAPV